jgi:hypothetical protein
MVKRPLILFFHEQNRELTISWPVHWRGLFWPWNEAGCSFFLWTLEATHHAQPKAPMPIFYSLFSTHFFGLPTKFGHSIPRSLNLDNYNVKRPLLCDIGETEHMGDMPLLHIIHFRHLGYYLGMREVSKGKP